MMMKDFGFLEKWSGESCNGKMLEMGTFEYKIQHSFFFNVQSLFL
jgi:hypothetical protein